MEDAEDKENLKGKVEDLNNQIKNAKKELDKLQDDCLHKEYEVKSVGEMGKNIRRVCVKCEKEVGYPSKQEIDDYVSK